MWQALGIVEKPSRWVGFLEGEIFIIFRPMVRNMYIECGVISITGIYLKFLIFFSQLSSIIKVLFTLETVT
jgi:hypothetical protein